jgi:histidine ammonia-lyase
VRAERLADVADLVVAMSLEAVRGNPSVLDPAVAAAKPVAGQVESAARIRALLDGSRLSVPGGAESVQDPISFRVVPQVHGAFREVVRFARAAVDGELAASDDNPLVVVADGRMISNGNFHPMLLALAVDAVRPALAHLGQLSDRRTGRVWDGMVSDPEAFTPTGLERLAGTGSPLLRYAGAARYAELRTIAGPATLDVGPLDLGVEDHATNAPLAARRTQEALALAEDILAVELLTATASLALEPDVVQRMGPATRAVHDLVGETLGAMAPGTPEADRHAVIRRRLVDGELGGGIGAHVSVQ